MTSNPMSRREALRRASILLGGALSMSTITGVMAGCESSAPQVGANGVWAPRTLSADQSEMVAIMGEQLIPETDTPGAKAARVHEFVDAMLTDYYQPEERARFLAGLERADARAQRAFGKPFLQASAEQQHQLVEVLNRAAYRESVAKGAGPQDPILDNEEATHDRTAQPGAADASAAAPLDMDWTRDDLGRKSFFRSLKELVLVGYYTSEPGATQELGVNPMGSWQADIPYSQVNHAWA